MSSRPIFSEERRDDRGKVESEPVHLSLPVGSEISRRKDIAKIVMISYSSPLMLGGILFEKLKAIEGKQIFASISLFKDSQREGYLITIYVSFPADAKKFENSINKILNEMKTAGAINSYYYVLPNEEGFLIDHNIRFITDFLGKRAAVLSNENLEAQFIAPRRRAERIGSWIIEIMGENLGEIFGEKLKELCWKRGFRICLETLHSSGEQRGILHQSFIEGVKDAQGSIIRIGLDRMIEEEILLENGINECGRYQLGVYKGFLSAVLGIKVEKDTIEEVKCISKGEKESIYIIKLPSNIPL